MVSCGTSVPVQLLSRGYSRRAVIPSLACAATWVCTRSEQDSLVDRGEDLASTYKNWMFEQSSLHQEGVLCFVTGRRCPAAATGSAAVTLARARARQDTYSLQSLTTLGLAAANH
jgi:hypothetical protein